jgi:hypothetical protein
MYVMFQEMKLFGHQMIFFKKGCLEVWSTLCAILICEKKHPSCCDHAISLDIVLL